MFPPWPEAKARQKHGFPSNGIATWAEITPLQATSLPQFEVSLPTDRKISDEPALSVRNKGGRLAGKIGWTCKKFFA
jgi:hypothetical protein